MGCQTSRLKIQSTPMQAFSNNRYQDMYHHQAFCIGEYVQCMRSTENMLDSKTNKSLFNARALKKANQVLKDIFLSYYYDAPGIEMYRKRMRPNGSIKKTSMTWT